MLNHAIESTDPNSLHKSFNFLKHQFMFWYHEKINKFLIEVPTD